MAKYRVLFSVRGYGHADERLRRGYSAMATAALAGGFTLAAHPRYGLIIKKPVPWKGNPAARPPEVKAVNERFKAAAKACAGRTGWYIVNGEWVTGVAKCIHERGI